MLFSAKRTAENYMSFEQVIDDTGAHVTKYSYWEAIIWDSNNLPNAPVYRQHIRSDEKDFIFLVQDDYQAKIISRYTFYGGKYSIGCKFGGVTIADGKINFFATDDTTKTVIANVDLNFSYTEEAGGNSTSGLQDPPTHCQNLYQHYVW